MRVLLALLLAAQAAQAASTPVVLAHSGRLFDGSDAAVEGQKTLKFAISTNAQKPVEGTETFAWSEQYDVTFRKGVYSLELGSTANGKLALPGDAVTGGPRYLVIFVEGVELSPRLRLGTVPAAYDAQNLNGRPATDYALAADVDAKLASGAIALKADLTTAFSAADTALRTELAAADTALQAKAADLDNRTKTLENSLPGLETASHASSTYALKADLAPLETAQHASTTYAAKTDLTPLETASHASATYAQKTDLAPLETASHAAQTFALKSDLSAYDTAATTATKFLPANADVDLKGNNLLGQGFFIEAENARPTNSVAQEIADSSASGGKAVQALSTGSSGAFVTFGGVRPAGNYDVTLRARVSTLDPPDPTATFANLKITLTPPGGTATVLHSGPLTVREFYKTGWIIVGGPMDLPTTGTLAFEFTYVAGKGVDLAIDWFRATPTQVRRIVERGGSAYSLDAVYCGNSETTNGAFAEGSFRGHIAGKAKCERICKSRTAHMCDASEVQRSQAMGLMPGVTGWFATNVFSTYTGYYIRDCAGWTASDSNPNQGVYLYANGGNGYPDNSSCSTPRPVLCCD